MTTIQYMNENCINVFETSLAVPIPCTCQNNGSCPNNDGICQCLDGHVGARCENDIHTCEIFHITIEVEGTCEILQANNAYGLVRLVAEYHNIPPQHVAFTFCEPHPQKVNIMQMNIDAYFTELDEVPDRITPTVYQVGGSGLVIRLHGVYESRESGVVLEFDCTGRPSGNVVADQCGVCGGSNDCVDCMGLPFGSHLPDSCDVCSGFAISADECPEREDDGQHDNDMDGHNMDDPADDSDDSDSSDCDSDGEDSDSDDETEVDNGDPKSRRAAVGIIAGCAVAASAGLMFLALCRSRRAHLNNIAAVRSTVDAVPVIVVQPNGLTAQPIQVTSAVIHKL
jgi:hypothetical protein